MNNLVYQTQGSGEAESAYNALTSYAKSIKESVFTSGPNTQKKRSEQVDLGALFTIECSKYSRGSEEIQAKIKDSKNRAWAFLLRLVEEVEKRLPANLEVFKQLDFFRPSSIFSKNFADMPFIGCIPLENLDDLEEEFRQFKQVDWKNTGPIKELEGGLPKDSVSFWSKVLEYTHPFVGDKEDDDNSDPDNSDPDDLEPLKPIQNLALFVLGRFTLAHSTAAVERIFSIVSVVKNKQRNLLKTEMLESILRVRSYLYARGKCCVTMNVNKEMLELFNVQMYKSTKNQGPDLIKIKA